MSRAGAGGFGEGVGAQEVRAHQIGLPRGPGELEALDGPSPLHARSPGLWARGVEGVPSCAEASLVVLEENRIRVRRLPISPA